MGTRNFIVVLGTSSRVAALAHTVTTAFRGVPGDHAAIDGVVAVTHTEGGMQETPRNTDLVLRTLAGFVVHPNVAAVLAVDEGSESITNRMLESYLRAQGYPLEHIPHRFISVAGNLRAARSAAQDTIAAWLPEADACTRGEHSLSQLRVALQCGGSDAFSGFSANPLVGWVAREIICCGGSACIAETTELMGAESYMLGNVRDLETARAFLDAITRYRELAGWHGHTPEGNPSGGNRMRGLYNIIVKSIGAALKKDPAVRLDCAIPYSARMTEPGFVFMDSPGNDLESVAGQVAAGCNVVMFTTGNGSITNFPFVPTIKIVSTTGRYEQLKNEMDVNAGACLDGAPLDRVGRQMFDLTLEVAGGRRTAGERAGHSQVQIWRNWQQDGTLRPDVVEQSEHYAGRPYPVREGRIIPLAFPARRPRVGLILPNSLCSGQVGILIAQRLEERRRAGDDAIARYVALPHTEGCGSHAADTGDVAGNTLLNYVVHPHVAAAVFLEHGCEKYHNRYFRELLHARNISWQRFGWASIQRDGGIGAATDKVEQWFAEAAGRLRREETRHPLMVGVHAPWSACPAVAAVTGLWCRSLVRAGGTVVVTSTTARPDGFRLMEEVPGGAAPAPTLRYGESPVTVGFHVMDVPTVDDNDILGGLGATGVEVILWQGGVRLYQTHPFIPIVQTADAGPDAGNENPDFRFRLDADPEAQAMDLHDLLARAAAAEYAPPLLAQELTAFQLSRGRLGVSL